MSRKRFIWIVSALILLALSPVVEASSQTSGKPDVPLFVALSSTEPGKFNDLYILSDGGFKPRTSGGYYTQPSISPDGQWLAVAVVSEQYMAYHAQHEKRKISPLPYDIRLVNTTNFAVVQLAGQPALDADAPRFTIRSEPAWSPSGHQLAWTEIDVQLMEDKNRELTPERLVVYDLDTKSVRVAVPELPQHTVIRGLIVVSDVAWGYPGVAVITYQPGGDDDAERVALYSPRGDLLWEQKPQIRQGFTFSSAIWVQRSDGAYDLTSIEGRYRFDGATGVRSVPICLTPELYSALAPNGISLFYNQQEKGEGSPVWVIAVNGEIRTSMADAGRYYHSSGLSIAPDGRQAAYIVYPGQGTQGGLYVFTTLGGKVRKDNNSVDGVAWGPVAWRWRAVTTLAECK